MGFNQGSCAKALAIAVGAATLLCGGPAAAAINLDTAVGQYIDKNGEYTTPQPDSMVIATASDPAIKAAGFVVHVTDLDSSKPGTDLIVGFPDAESWAKFEQMWHKALTTKRSIHMGEVEIGDYFDQGDAALLEVGVTYEGVDLTMIGKDNDATTIGEIVLLPEQLTAFDANVATVSAYFKS